MVRIVERTRRITRIGSMAGFVVAIAGAVALVTFVVSMASGDTLQFLNDLALLVMVGALAPLMLSFYELGGLTPLWPARLFQTLGWISVVTFCAVQLGQMAGMLSIDWFSPATGIFAAATLALGYVGLWIAGGNLLAGPWLPAIRWLGVVAGLGVALYAAGLLLGGVDSGIAGIGALGFLLLLPIWALLMARLLAGLPADVPAAGEGHGDLG
jgi:hypothetical protein